MKDKSQIRTKKRPRRLFYDEKSGKYFYLINKRKKYVKVPSGISQKQIAKINIKNIIAVPVRRRIVKSRRDVKPILSKQIVSKLVPIAPVAQNLTGQLYTPKDNEKLLERLTKLEEKFKPVDTTKEEKETTKPTFTEKIKGFMGIKQKVPKPTSSNVFVEAERLRKEREDELDKLEERKYKEEEIDAVEKGFFETNPDLELFYKDEGKLEQPTGMFGSLFGISSKPKKTQWEFNDEFRSNLKSIVSNWKLLSTDDEIKQGWQNFKNSTKGRTDKTGITEEKFRKFLKLTQRETNPEEKEEEPRVSFLDVEGNIIGSGAYSNDKDGIFSDELQDIFRDKTNRFLPVISSDEMEELLPLVNRDTQTFGWIQNTEPRSSMGRHWVAYFIDIPNLEVNYYDSLVENGGLPPKSSLKGLKKIIDKIHPEYYLLFKNNLIRDQDPKSSNCGYFSLKFLMDRYRGIPFRIATGYNEIYGNGVVDNFIEGENKIERFKNFL